MLNEVYTGYRNLVATKIHAIFRNIVDYEKNVLPSDDKVISIANVLDGVGDDPSISYTVQIVRSFIEKEGDPTYTTITNKRVPVEEIAVELSIWWGDVRSIVNWNKHDNKIKFTLEGIVDSITFEGFLIALDNVASNITGQSIDGDIRYFDSSDETVINYYL